MSVKINSLSATPRRLNSALGQQQIQVSWDAKMTANSDNPVSVELNILPDNPVYFVSSNNKHVKTVSWQQNFKPGDNLYTDTIVMIVTLAQSQTEVTKLRIDSLDANGIKSGQTFAILYK